MAANVEADARHQRREERREDDEEEEEKVVGKRAEFVPWEQHAVIKIPRYNYAAAGSFVREARSAFLVTCPIKREKSATKEAFSILEQYIDKRSGHVAGSRGILAKPVEISKDEDKNAFDEAGEKQGLVFQRTEEEVDPTRVLSLVKLSRNGLLLLSFQDNSYHCVVMILSNIFCSLRCGNLKPPRWCHRIIPIQETCVLSETELHIVVLKLFQEFFIDEEKDYAIKFAVSYNRRGIDDMAVKHQKKLGVPHELNLMTRESCFHVVAGAVKAVALNSTVDLKCPEVVVLVELIPVFGTGSLPVAGVSVLPANLISTKPRLNVKSLVANSDPMENSTSTP